jgi:hypothetical protein
VASVIGRGWSVSFFVHPLPFIKGVIMGIRQVQERLLTLTAVDATPIDGSTALRTYQNAHKVGTYYVGLNQDTDAVEIIADATGSDGNTAVFNLLGYGVPGTASKPETGPANRIFNAVTATLGTAVAATGRLFVEHFTGSDLHTKTIGLYDSALGGNGIAKICFDTRGLSGLYFEPVTFTTLTDLTFHIRELQEYH